MEGQWVKGGEVLGSFGDKGADFGQVPLQLLVPVDSAGDFLIGVDNGGVIAMAEEMTDFRQGLVTILAEEEHGDVPGVSDGPEAGWAGKGGDGEVEVGGYGINDGVWRWWPGLGRSGKGCYGLEGDRFSDGTASEGGDSDAVGETALQVADVVLEALSDEAANIRRQGDGQFEGFGLEDSQAGLKIRRLDLGDEAPLEAGAEAAI